VSLNQTSRHAFALVFGGEGAPEDNQTVELSCAFESVCCVGPKPPGSKSALAGKSIVSMTDAVSHTTAMYVVPFVAVKTQSRVLPLSIITMFARISLITLNHCEGCRQPHDCHVRSLYCHHDTILHHSYPFHGATEAIAPTLPATAYVAMYSTLITWCGFFALIDILSSSHFCLLKFHFFNILTLFSRIVVKDFWEITAKPHSHFFSQSHHSL
jgi:hypothetical protein